MGVRGLAGWIHWAAASSVKTPVWEHFRGKCVGLDVLGFLYKAKAQKCDPIAYLGSFIAAANHSGIRLVAVFDGKPPEAKRNTVGQRSAAKMALQATKHTLQHDLAIVSMSNECKAVLESKVRALDSSINYLTAEERNRAKQLCYACGVLPLNACGEADTVLTYFMKQNIIEAIISNDYDYLTRGVETLLVPEGLALPGGSLSWKMYNLSAILKTVKFTYNNFVEMCVLMGCDYTHGELSLPYKTAYWAIKYRGAIEYTLQHYAISNIMPYKTAVNLYTGSESDRYSLMGEKQWLKLNEPIRVEPEALATFRSIELASLSDSEYTLLYRGTCQ